MACLTPFWVGAVIAVVAAVLVLAIFEPDQPRPSPQRALLPRSLDLYVTSIVMGVVFFAVFRTVYGVTQLSASEHLGVSQTTQGLLLLTFIAPFVVVVVESPYLSRLVGTTWVVATGMAFVGGGVALTPFADLPVLFAGEALVGTGVGLTYGLLMAMSVEKVPPGQRFYAMGIFQSIYAVGMFFGPWVAGLITQAFGVPVAFVSIGLFVLLAGAAYVLVNSKAVRSTPGMAHS